MSDEAGLIPGIDCSLGRRIGSADFCYTPPRCECGCPIDYVTTMGWHCWHCDGDDDFTPCPNQVQI